MNPFVNPKERTPSLPKGCKDLVDVLNGPDRQFQIAIKRYTRLVLLQAWQDRATELVIAPVGAGGTPIRYKVKGTWYSMSPFPVHIRPGVVAELVRMAKLPKGSYPKGGCFTLVFENEPMQWKIKINEAESDCVLTPVDE
jgi:hypothetical protein